MDESSSPWPVNLSLFISCNHTSSTPVVFLWTEAFLGVRGKMKLALSFPVMNVSMSAGWQGQEGLGDTDMHRTDVSHGWKGLAENQRT